MKRNSRQILLTSSAACLMITAAVFAGPPTTGDVGDTDSFQKNARFLGDASGFITVASSCPASTPATSPANSDQCFSIDPTPGNTTVINAPNIDRINLPGGAAKDVIYPVLTFFTSYQMQNPTAAQVPNARFLYSASLTIYSAVLNDPSIIDPNTGLPAGAL